MKKIILNFVFLIIFVLLNTLQVFSQRIPICPEEDYPEDVYETYDPQLNLRLCLNGLGLGCDNCCVTFYYFKRYVNGGNYLDFQLDYVVWEDLNDPGNPQPQNCVLCGRLNEELIRMIALKKIFLRHCNGGSEYDFRNQTSYNHHVVMRSGCVAPGPDGYPLVCELTGCCFKTYKITINQLGTTIQIEDNEEDPIDYYYNPNPQICTDPPPCELKCGLVANLNAYVSNPKETLGDDIITETIKFNLDEINNNLNFKFENNDRGLVQIFIYNYTGEVLKHITFYKKDIYLSQMLSLDGISCGLYFTNVMINGILKASTNFYLIK